MPRPRDTSPDIEEKMFEAFRAMSFEKKLWILSDAYRTGRMLKLECYRLGDEVSEQQWRDVRGVLKTKGPELDFEYLDKWAAELGVADLLVKARLDV